MSHCSWIDPGSLLLKPYARKNTTHVHEHEVATTTPKKPFCMPAFKSMQGLRSFEPSIQALTLTENREPFRHTHLHGAAISGFLNEIEPGKAQLHD